MTYPRTNRYALPEFRELNDLEDRRDFLYERAVKYAGTRHGEQYRLALKRCVKEVHDEILWHAA